MRIAFTTRLCALLLLLCLVWAALGSPLSAGEWHSLPTVVRRLLVQWPGRTLPVWRQWLLRPAGFSASAA